jgi:hypothetical protein
MSKPDVREKLIAQGLDLSPVPLQNFLGYLRMSYLSGQK